MDPFTAAVLIISGGVQIFGKLKANEAEADAQRQNAAFFREQQKLSQAATRREVDIFERESDAFFGSQVSAYAKAGVDLSGSILQSLTQSKQSIKSERSAIIEQGKLKANLAGMRADQALAEAKRAEDSSFFDVISTIAQTGTAIAGSSKTSSSSSSDGFFSGSSSAAKKAGVL